MTMIIDIVLFNIFFTMTRHFRFMVGFFPHVIVLSLFSLLLIGCNKSGASIPDPLEKGLLTGECLRSNNLKTSLHIDSKSFDFAFALEMDSKTEESVGNNLFTRVPSPSVFLRFGDNSTDIQSEYDRLLDEFIHNQPSYTGLLFASTIFYDNGMILTADKPFAGHAVGDNLFPFCTLKEQGLYSMDSIYFSPKCLGYNYMIPYDMMTPFLSFQCSDFKIVDEDITFTLKIPVKVGMYLTWLNNRIANPNAEMQYEEIILEGQFKSGKGLH